MNKLISFFVKAEIPASPRYQDLPFTCWVLINGQLMLKPEGHWVLPTGVSIKDALSLQPEDSIHNSYCDLTRWEQMEGPNREEYGPDYLHFLVFVKNEGRIVVLDRRELEKINL